MNRRELLVAGSAAVASLLAGCAGDSPDESTTASVTDSITTADGDGGATPTDTATDATATATTDATTTTSADATTATGTARVAATVEVAPDGQLRFDPETVEIRAGESVRWIWRGNGHNVTPGETPDGATWSGSEGSPNRTFDTDHEYVHTFETVGTFEYYCSPHRSFGMTGTVEVV